MISYSEFDLILQQLRDHPEPLNGMALQDHIDWSENASPPESADDFALEAIYVICNSGMKHTVARRIYERVKNELLAGGRIHTEFRKWQGLPLVFGHEGKSGAIDVIWDNRQPMLDAYLAADDKVEFCGSLPWIGKITKYHLAKNFGADVAKPDVHLERLAKRHGTTPQELCDHLAAMTGLKSRTIDLVLWMACAKGVLRP